MTQSSLTRSALALVTTLALATGLVWALAQTARAATTWTFYGITVHVSTNNIKVQDPRTKQVMSFLLVPKFDQVFSANGKTTYQMGKVKAGQYVAVVYDRKALGGAHADKIYLMDNANEKIGAQ
jgi:hypothetical protein